jgi:hypothetical protein
MYFGTAVGARGSLTTYTVGDSPDATHLIPRARIRRLACMMQVMQILVQRSWGSTRIEPLAGWRIGWVENCWRGRLDPGEDDRRD